MHSPDAFGVEHSYDNGTFWASAWDTWGTYLIGFDDATLAAQHSLNTTTWPNGSNVAFVVAVFANPRTSGLVVIGSAGSGPLFVYSITEQFSAAPAVAFLGPLPCADCSDFTWDSLGEVIYAIVDEESQTDSGSLLAISTASGTPTVVANITLQVDAERGGGGGGGACF